MFASGGGGGIQIALFLSKDIKIINKVIDRRAQVFLKKSDDFDRFDFIILCMMKQKCLQQILTYINISIIE